MAVVGLGLQDLHDELLLEVVAHLPLSDRLGAAPAACRRLRAACNVLPLWHTMQRMRARRPDATPAACLRSTPTRTRDGAAPGPKADFCAMGCLPRDLKAAACRAALRELNLREVLGVAALGPEWRAALIDALAAAREVTITLWRSAAERQLCALLAVLARRCPALALCHLRVPAGTEGLVTKLLALSQPTAGAPRHWQFHYCYVAADPEDAPLPPEASCPASGPPGAKRAATARAKGKAPAEVLEGEALLPGSTTCLAGGAGPSGSGGGGGAGGLSGGSWRGSAMGYAMCDEMLHSFKECWRLLGPPHGAMRGGAPAGGGNDGGGRAAYLRRTRWLQEAAYQAARDARRVRMMANMRSGGDPRQLQRLVAEREAAVAHACAAIERHQLQAACCAARSAHVRPLPALDAAAMGEAGSVELDGSVGMQLQGAVGEGAEDEDGWLGLGSVNDALSGEWVMRE